MEPLSLRDRQRLRRHRTILFSAAKLFETKGFAETTMEEIAALAEVSPPTIYNYFRSKSDILLGLLEVDKELMEDALDTIINTRKGNGLDIIGEFVRTDLEGGYDVSQKSVWRMISAAAFEASGDRSSDYVEAQSVFMGKLRLLIARLQQEGEVRADADPVDIARVVNSITRESFRNYIRTEAMSMSQAIEMAHSQLRLLWRGLAP